MEVKDFKVMLQLYKVKLADMEEQNILYQAVISSQSTEKETMKLEIEELKSRIITLESQITNLNSSVEVIDNVMNNAQIETINNGEVQ